MPPPRSHAERIELAPGETVTHSETWEVYKWPEASFISDKVRQKVNVLQNG